MSEPAPPASSAAEDPIGAFLAEVVAAWAARRDRRELQRLLARLVWLATKDAGRKGPSR